MKSSRKNLEVLQARAVDCSLLELLVLVARPVEPVECLCSRQFCLDQLEDRLALVRLHLVELVLVVVD